ncbi:hypothetical protein [Pseudomonas gozinkensis]|uniref:hypothetical protein n=1 Tax=Pseudomonas gozinkensis TaxID=2774461 RepID=UPI0017888FA5|nr:hypothetical protein [Pseudomonas gozinkensis]
MPVTIRFYLDSKTFGAPSNPLSIGVVIDWLSKSGYQLDLYRGEGLMLAEFLGRTTKTYGFLLADDFLKDLKAFVYPGPSQAVSRPVNPRKTPESEGVFMAPPQTDITKHAKDRMQHQLRLFLIMILMKCNGCFSSASADDVELSKTIFQHGQGNLGEAAAHKIMATFTVKKKQLESITGDNACRTFLIYLQSETSILKSYFNSADSEVETLIRNDLLIMAKNIVSDPYLVKPMSLDSFKEHAGSIWSTLHGLYFSACRKALLTAAERMKLELHNYNCRKLIPNIPLEKLMEAKKKSAEAAFTSIVLDTYFESAQNTVDCPLSEGEIENLYDVFTDPTTAAELV